MEQFRSNGYQRPFFSLDRRISRAEFAGELLIPEIRAKLDFLSLKTDLPGKAERQRRYARIVRNEVRRLEAQTGTASGLTDGRFSVESLLKGDAAAVTAYLGRLAAGFSERKRRAVEERQALAAELVRRYGPEGWEALRRRHQKRGIVDLVRNREELDALRLSGDRIVQLSDPVYQRAESPWGRAVFMASEKRLHTLTLETYPFNLLVLGLMTVLLAVLLHLRVLQRMLSR